MTDVRRWDPDDGDDTAVRNCLDVWQAAMRADDPLGSPKSPHALRAWMRHGFRGYPGEVWLAPGADGALAGWYRLGLPRFSNRTTADLNIWVRPQARRRGLGSELLRHAAQRATANDRTVMSGMTREGTAGEAFARDTGAAPGIVLSRRLLVLAEIPPGKLRGLRDEAAAKAVGYSVVRWAGATPGEHVDAIGAVFEAMNDAPHDEGRERQVYSAERVRRMDRTDADFGMHTYSVAAVHDATGEIAALTQVFADPDTVGWGHQGMTAVTRPHRGHRLGLLVKTVMLEWLAGAEPRLERIDTGNADGNEHMIAVNDVLGYKLFGPAWVSYQLPVEKAAR